jgi:hypothetical protein
MNIGSTINPINRMEGYIKNCIKPLENSNNNLTPSQIKVLYRGKNMSKEMLFYGYKK